MENWVIIETTDNKNIGNKYTVPTVDKTIAFLMSGQRFWFDEIKYSVGGQYLTLRNSNYYVKLQRDD